MTMPSNNLRIPDKTKKRRNSHYHELATEKTHQSRLALSVIVSVAILIYSAKKYGLTIYNVSGIMNGILFAHFFILLFSILISCQDLHHVRVKRRRSLLGGQLFVPYAVETDKSTPLYSVSSIVGLRGSNTEKLISSLMYLVVGNSVCSITMNIIESNNDESFLTNIMALIGAYGLWLLLTWQVEHTFESDVKHGISFFIGFICTFIALLIQQHYSLFSVLLVIISIISLFLYGLLSLTKCKREMIHTQSISMLLLESVALVCWCLASVMYVYCLHDE